MDENPLSDSEKQDVPVSDLMYKIDDVPPPYMSVFLGLQARNP